MWPFSSPKASNTSTREDRQRCWDARDQYFACLDRAAVVKPGDEKPSRACGSEGKSYEESCAKSWIEYFNQRRVIGEAQKDRLAQADTQARNAKQ
ncbi:cytochrome oxidase c subunit VIb-domain-containing protein [Rhodocollybia butyracea]|uniref:Cytochrome oxidase c subunit VIb-domain-containing protein n=1 Tax=Rhodocollybia butyracea TaxID=206335 RepID=A0A9P5PC90_9AGAR|nr:cytochrome oxidase c subunit VIb-domain-containing protein [Rhodocollybia butyracea]